MNFEKYTTLILENAKTVDDAVNIIEKNFKKHFPKSFIRVSSKSSLGGSDISMKFAIGEKSDWASGYIENDPMYHLIWIWGTKDGEDFTTNKYKVTMSIGNRIATKEKDSKHPWLSVIKKIGWRNKTANINGAIKHLDDYFKKMKVAAKQYKDDLPDYVAKKI